MEYKTLLKESFLKNNLNISENRINSIVLFIKILLKWNKHIKLISENDKFKIIDRHIIDSIKLFDNINSQDYVNIADIGAGNGFPGILLGIYYTEKKIYLIEKRKAKASFLKQCVYELKLNNIIVFDKDASLFNYEKIDIVLARAFGDIDKICKLINKQYSGKIGIYKKGKIEIYNVPHGTL